MSLLYHGVLVFSLTFFNLIGATISNVLVKMVLKLLVISSNSSVCLGMHMHDKSVLTEGILCESNEKCFTVWSK